MAALKTPRILIFAGIIGPVFYLLLLITLGSIWAGYNPIIQSMSEIGGVSSPYKDIMNYLGFSLLGIFIVLFSIGLRREFGGGVLGNISFFFLLIAGASMVAVGFYPCDAGCIDVTQTGKMHSILSTPPSITLPLAAIAMANVFTRRWGKKWGYISFWLGVFSMISGPVMFLPFVASYLGLVQRIGIGLSLGWMFVVSMKLLKN